MKYQGAGPRQNQISPENSMSFTVARRAQASPEGRGCRLYFGGSGDVVRGADGGEVGGVPVGFVGAGEEAGVGFVDGFEAAHAARDPAGGVVAWGVDDDVDLVLPAHREVL